MKSSLFLFALLSLMMSVTSCKNEKKAEPTPTMETTPPMQDPNMGAPPQGNMPDNMTPSAPPQPEPAQNAKGVWHFTCSKGCPGGAGTKGNCAKCGNPLTHNQAYHTDM